MSSIEYASDGETMNKRSLTRTTACLAGCALLLALSPVAANPSPTPADKARKLLQEIDDLWRGDSSHARLSMQVKTKHYTRTLRMEAWSKGEKHSLIRILAPKREKGTASLKSGKHLYTYLPRTDRVIRLTSAMMAGNWMGSHFSNDDLVKESRMEDDFNAKITFEGDRKGVHETDITLIPKASAAIVWGKVIATIDTRARLPKRQRYYDEDGKLVRTMTFSEVKTFGKRRAPALMRVTVADKPNEYTEMRYEHLDVGNKIPDGFFSIARLKRRR